MKPANKNSLSYRYRLLLTLGVIWLFLVAVLIVTNWLHRSTLIDQGHDTLTIIGKQVQMTMDRETQGIQRQVNLLAQHTDLQRQLSTSVRLKRNVIPGRLLADIRSTLLPGQKLVIISRAGDVIVGKQEAILVDALAKQREQVKPPEKLFYLPNKNGVERVATAPIKIRQRRLGTVVISHAIDDQWLEKHSVISQHQLVMTDENKVVLTTLGKKNLGGAFIVNGRKALLSEKNYLIRGLTLNKASNNASTLQLWLVRPLDAVLEPVTKRLPILYMLAIVGALLLVLAGRNLLLPLTDFAASVRRIIKGLRQGRFVASRQYGNDEELGYIERQIFKLAKTLHSKHIDISETQLPGDLPGQTDPLTGLGTRSQLYEMYSKHLYEAKRYQKRLVVVIADIDKLKAINDSNGHLAGDYSIQHVAKLLQRSTRDSDYLFYIGGGKFCILNTGSADGGLVQAEKVRAKLERLSLKVKDKQIQVTASFGVAQTGIANDENGLDALLSRANKAVDIAKSTGNRVAVWDMEIAQAG